MSQLSEFIPLVIDSQLMHDFRDSPQHGTVMGWNRQSGHRFGKQHTAFGIVVSGDAILKVGRLKLGLTAGMFFVIPGEGTVESPTGSGLVIHVNDYRGLFHLGGPIEAEGRLRYIDGCSDTLLVCPSRLGEPCLNHLHIPAHTDQTAHTHPSDRIGVILRGSGECWTPSGNHKLTAGMGWRIPAGSLHSFHTIWESLDVIAWHPDSDFGPTDDNHPMINRTILETRVTEDG